MSNKFSAATPGWREWERQLGILPEHWKDAERIFLRLAVRGMIVGAKDYASKLEGQDGIYRKAVKDLRASGNTLRYGGQPWSMGAEYGSLAYKQFLPWRGNGPDAGYFFWPAVRRYQDVEITRQYFETVWHAVKAAFPGYS